MSVDRSNCNVIVVVPTPDSDVISATPGTELNCCSSGVATAEAIVSGLAPGKLPVTVMVGKSTLGSEDTGRKRYAVTPNTMTPNIKSVVATGRRMQGAEMFIAVAAQSAGRAGAAD